MARPKKDESERRTGQIVVYVQEPIKQALQAEADSRGMTVSTLAAEILEDHISSTKYDDQRIVVHPDIIYAVLRQLAIEGFTLSDKFAPKDDEPQKPVQQEDSKAKCYQQPIVDNSVDNAVDKSGANLSPKNSDPMQHGTNDAPLNIGRSTPRTTRQRRKAVNRNKHKGGDET